MRIKFHSAQKSGHPVGDTDLLAFLGPMAGVLTEMAFPASGSESKLQ